MKQLCTIDVTTKFASCSGPVDIVEWTAQDPFPELGASVGVDTETELITETCYAPKLVVLGVYDGSSRTAYIINWRDATVFMRELNKRSIEQRYFNVGFDEMVLDNEDPDQTLMTALNENRVIDMQTRVHLHEIATTGFVGHKMYSLAGCAANLLGVHLDKGDGTEQSARLSFKRFDASGVDYKLTEEQIRYLPMDCITTWMLGEVILPQATEEVHTKGAVVLYHIKANGMRVDPVVHKALTDALHVDMNVYKEQLKLYDFPLKEDIEVSAADTATADLKSNFAALTNIVTNYNNSREPSEVFTHKGTLRRMLTYLYNVSDDAQDYVLGIYYVLIAGTVLLKDMKKAEMRIYDELCEKFDILAFEEAKLPVILITFVSKVMESYIQQLKQDTVKVKGFDFEKAVAYAGQYMDDHPELSTPKPVIGPTKFLQNHLEDLMVRYPKLELDRTPKSHAAKCTIKDMWRLADIGIDDKFMKAYTNYKHTEKYLSTYLSPKDVKADSRVHPSYTNLLRTGRTSCSTPNIQNLPARDTTYPIRNMFCGDKDMILCSTDFSFIELVCFAESCIQRFGFSVMGDIINADVDPHRWFAGCRSGIITSDTSFTKDKKAIEELKAFLKANVSDSERQHAKAANFGFGGGMSAKKFWITCREQGIDISLDDAVRLRQDWIGTFKEMALHEVPEVIPSMRGYSKQFGINVYTDGSDEVEDDEDEFVAIDKSYESSRLYVARLVNGMVRNRCTYCAALNVQFQGLAAYGLKLALWELTMNGLLPRMVNEVHDEVLYCLYPEEVKLLVPAIESLMIQGMQKATPHVKVKVETECMLHWDKKATKFSELLWDAKGNPILTEPEYVAQAYQKQKAS